MERNKIIYGGQTLIDLTDATAVASDIASGKTAYGADGTLLVGTNTDSEWTSGIYKDGDGYIRVSPLAGAGGVLFDGGYVIFSANAGDSAGEGGSGASVTQDANGYIVLPSTGGSGGSGVSATQHTIHLEFSDNTDEDIDVYYDDSLIGTMITAYNPTTWTYSSKTVYVAELDGVEWYDATPSAVTWETIYDEEDVTVSNNGNGTGYVYVSGLASTQIPDGSEWRTTIDGYAYVATAQYYSQISTYGIPHYNSSNVNDAIFYNNGSAWIIYLLLQDSGKIDAKIERAVTS